MGLASEGPKARLSRLRGSDWFLYVVRAGVVLANVVTTLVLGYFMAPDAFGRFVLLWVASNAAASIVSLGGPQFLLRELSARKAGADRGVTLPYVLRLVLLYPMLLLGALGVLSWGASGILAEIGISGYGLSAQERLLILGVAASLNLISHLSVFLRVGGHSNAGMVVYGILPHALLVVSFGVCAVGDSLDVVSLLAVFVLLGLGSAALGFSWVIREKRAASYFRDSGRSTPYAFGFWWIGVLGTFHAQIDILIGSLFLSSASIGTYQILKRFANLLSLPQIVANWVVAVDVGRLYAKGDHQGLRRQSTRGLRLTAAPALALLLACLAGLPLILTIYGIPATWANVQVYLFLLTASLVSLFFGVNVTVAQQCHLEKHILFGRFTAVAATALLLMLASDELTESMLAITFALATLLAQAYVWYSVKRGIGLDTSMMTLFRASAPP